jgi:hypothetical protein
VAPPAPAATAARRAAGAAYGPARSAAPSMRAPSCDVEMSGTSPRTPQPRAHAKGQCTAYLSHAAADSSPGTPTCFAPAQKEAAAQRRKQREGTSHGDATIARSAWVRAARLVFDESTRPVATAPCAAASAAAEARRIGIASVDAGLRARTATVREGQHEVAMRTKHLPMSAVARIGPRCWRRRVAEVVARSVVRDVQRHCPISERIAFVAAHGHTRIPRARLAFWHKSHGAQRDAAAGNLECVRCILKDEHRAIPSGIRSKQHVGMR